MIPIFLLIGFSAWNNLPSTFREMITKSYFSYSFGAQFFVPKVEFCYFSTVTLVPLESSSKRVLFLTWREISGNKGCEENTHVQKMKNNVFMKPKWLHWMSWRWKFSWQLGNNLVEVFHAGNIDGCWFTVARHTA